MIFQLFIITYNLLINLELQGPPPPPQATPLTPLNFWWCSIAQSKSQLLSAHFFVKGRNHNPGFLSYRPVTDLKSKPSRPFSPEPLARESELFSPWNTSILKDKTFVFHFQNRLKIPTPPWQGSKFPSLPVGCLVGVGAVRRAEALNSYIAYSNSMNQHCYHF